MLGQQSLLYPSMSPGMEGIQPRVLTHFGQSVVEPCFVGAPENRTKNSVVVPGLEQRSFGVDVLLTNDVAERGDCSYGADERTTVVPGEWNFLHSLATLDGLGESQLEDDSADSVEVEVLEVTPTDETFRVDFAVGPSDKAGAA